MKKIVRSALGAALAATGLAACDAPPPPKTAVSPPVESMDTVESQPIAGPETLADVVRDKDPFSRALKLGALLPMLGREVVPEVKETLENWRLELGLVDLHLLLLHWATYEPEEASRWAVERSPKTVRAPAVYVAYTTWAKTDPQAAIAAMQPWIERGDRNVSPNLLPALVLGWFAANDPPELRQYIHDLGAGLPRQRALSTYVFAVIKKHGIEAVMRWAESLPDGDASYKKDVFNQVGFRLSTLDLEASKRWCEAHCDGPFGRSLRGMVASSWVQSEPEAALEWLADAPEGLDRRRDLRLSFEAWTRRDRQAALDWMAARTSGGEPDPWLRDLYMPYARALAQDSPADAIEWAERIELPGERRPTLLTIARGWCRVDEAACEAWLLQSALSEEDREIVRAARPARREQNAEPQPGG